MAGRRNPEPSGPGAQASGPGRSLGSLFWLWLKIGCINFGGPAGQIALMHRIFVEQKRWLSERRFLHALNYCMLLPGPEAQQLATYIGWLTHRTLGGVVAGVLFVLPGALLILGLSVLYVLYAELPAIQGVLFGIKAAVLAIVVEALLRLSRRTMRHTELAFVAAAAFAGIFLFDLPFPVIVLGAGVLGLAGGWLAPGRWTPNPESGGHEPEGEAMPSHTRPSARRALRLIAVFAVLWGGPVLALAALLGSDHTFAELAVFFSTMAVVTFGGAYAVLAYVAQEAVATYGWLRPAEMMHGLGLAETTPGPLILVLQFVGFLGAYRHPEGLDPMLAGVLGALLTSWITFVPSFLWIFLGAPYIEALRGLKILNAALSGVTAAVTGVILNLAVWFGLHVLFGQVTETEVGIVRLWVPDLATPNWMALAIAVGAFAALQVLKWPLPAVLLLCAGAGLLYTL